MLRSTCYLLLLVLASCGGGESEIDGGGTAVDASSDADANSDFDRPAGLFTVREYSGTIYLSGQVFAEPPLELRVESQRIGACRLMTYTPSFCDPPCIGFDLCIASECQTPPLAVDRGSVEWSWPGGQTTVSPDSYNNYSANGAVTGPGETTLTIEAELLRAGLVERPEQIGDWGDSIHNRTGDVTLQWSNPVAGARVRLEMTDCMGSHGGIGESEIECEGTDSGELVLPGVFLDILDDGDWSHGECGSHELVRFHADAVSDGEIRLEAQASASFFYFPDRP